MKLLVHMCLFVSFLFANNFDSKITKYKKELSNITMNQKMTMLNSHTAGLKNGYSYTLMAISWRESMFNKWPINLGDGNYGSYGPFHNLLESVAKREGININSWTASRLAEKLTISFKFASEQAIKEITYWDRFHDGDWRSIWASYNAGHSGLDSKYGKKYSDDIAARVIVLKEYMKKHGYE